MKVYIVLFTSNYDGFVATSVKVCSTYEKAKEVMDSNIKELCECQYADMGYVKTEGEWSCQIKASDNYWDEITICEEDVND